MDPMSMTDANLFHDTGHLKLRHDAIIIRRKFYVLVALFLLFGHGLPVNHEKLAPYS